MTGSKLLPATPPLASVSDAVAAAALNYPNICTIYEIGRQDAHSYIAMELLEGVTLKHRMVPVLADALPRLIYVPVSWPVAA